MARAAKKRIPEPMCQRRSDRVQFSPDRSRSPDDARRFAETLEGFFSPCPGPPVEPARAFPDAAVR
jgi:hypothetical protein